MLEGILIAQVKLTIPISGRTRTTLELAPNATQAEAIELGQENGFTSYNRLSQLKKNAALKMA
ncbi:hypothetical protein C7B76_18590 [filamentous cyanobacterium CCP2]|nr:hypothetical protein C7B76_18590 [filamentous cyanobacterium CCP2]